MFAEAEKGDKHISSRLMRGCAPKHCDHAVWGVALLCSGTISFCHGYTHSCPLLFQLLEKELHLCKCVARRCALGTSSLLLSPNLTFHLNSHPSQKLNLPMLCSFVTIYVPSYVPLYFFFVCFLVFFWSSADYPAHPSIVCARFSRQFTCRRSSGMLQLLHSRRERSLFFSFSDMDNIPSAGERAHQEASVKGRER